MNGCQLCWFRRHNASSLGICHTLFTNPMVHCATSPSLQAMNPRARYYLHLLGAGQRAFPWFFWLGGKYILRLQMFWYFRLQDMNMLAYKSNQAEDHADCDASCEWYQHLCMGNTLVSQVPVGFMIRWGFASWFVSKPGAFCSNHEMATCMQRMFR